MYFLFKGSMYHVFLELMDILSTILTPEGRLGMSDVSPRLESQGCHLIPFYCLLSCFSA